MHLNEIGDIFAALERTHEFDKNDTGRSYMEHLWNNNIKHNIPYPQQVVVPKAISTALRALVKRSAALAQRKTKMTDSEAAKRAKVTNDVIAELSHFVVDDVIHRPRPHSTVTGDAEGRFLWSVGTPSDVVKMWDDVVLPVILEIRKLAFLPSFPGESAEHFGKLVTDAFADVYESGIATKQTLTKLKSVLKAVLVDMKKIMKTTKTKRRSESETRSGSGSRSRSGSASAPRSVAACVDGFVQLPCKVGYRKKHYVNILGKKVYIE